MTEWTCDDCGLKHCHSKTVHQLWDMEGLSWDYIKHEMKFNPACNCGAYELKRDFEEGNVFGYVDERAADTIRSITPIVPKTVEKEIENKVQA